MAGGAGGKLKRRNAETQKAERGGEDGRRSGRPRSESEAGEGDWGGEMVLFLGGGGRRGSETARTCSP